MRVLRELAMTTAQGQEFSTLISVTKKKNTPIIQLSMRQLAVFSNMSAEELTSKILSSSLRQSSSLMRSKKNFEELFEGLRHHKTINEPIKQSL